MQKQKHRSNSKTKENPSPASGLQGKDSSASKMETCGRRARKQREGTSRGKRLEETGWQSGDKAGPWQRVLEDGEQSAQCGPSERRDPCQPWPLPLGPTTSPGPDVLGTAQSCLPGGPVAGTSVLGCPHR